MPRQKKKTSAESTKLNVKVLDTLSRENFYPVDETEVVWSDSVGYRQNQLS